MLPDGQDNRAGEGPTGPLPLGVVAPAQGTGENATPNPAAGHPTAEQIAERVYELFRRDLRVYLERKGL